MSEHISMKREDLPPRDTHSAISPRDKEELRSQLIKESSKIVEPIAVITKTTQAASSKSKRSTASSAARRKQLELEAAEAKAKIQMELIDRRLEAELAQIEAEEAPSGDGSKCSSISDNQVKSNVAEWLNHSHAVTSQAHNQSGAALAAVVKEPLIQHVEDPVNSIRQLAHELKDLMVNSSSKQDNRLLTRIATPRDLPSFSGDCIEWLHFKSAYEESTRVCQFSDLENLWRLRKALRGDALAAVTDLLIGNTTPAAVIKALQLRFGRSDIIIQNINVQLKKLPPLPICYQHDLFNFSIKVNNCIATIRALKQDDYLCSPELATALMSKLPSTLISKWTDYAYSRLLQGETKLELLGEFLNHEAEMLSIVGITQPPEQRKTDYQPKRYEDIKSRSRPVFATTSVEVNNADKLCKFCKKESHLLPDCRVFKRAMRRDKWNFMKTHKLCYCCMITRHDRNTCPAPVCDIDGCGLAHHRLLHWKKPVSQTHQPTSLDDSQGQTRELGQSRGNSTVAHIASDGDNTSTPSDNVMLKVVAVTLCGPNGSVSTYALLDDAASVSIMDSELSNELGLKAEQSSAIKFIDAFGLEVFQSDAPKLSVQISGEDTVNHNIKLRKVSNLKLPMQNLSVINNINCKHLLHIKDRVCKERVVPRLLIGEDNYFLLAPLEVIHGNKNVPYATRCRLGWTIHGYCGRTHSNSDVSKHVFHVAHSEKDSTDFHDLNDIIKNSFALDSIGISTLCRENTAHLRATQILDDTSRQIGDQWEVGLPFTKDDFVLPDSYDYALSRLQTLFKKFQRDHAYAEKYAKEMTKLFHDGYARVLSERELAAVNTWYLPHFGVQNSNKLDKLRLVFDAKGQVNGKCLNDYLLTGPDLYNSLFGIMLRFRENKIAVVGDIKDMFLRIKIRPEDQQVLRFLWRESSDTPIQHCAMQSLVFGATCSPFIAQYVRNKNALKYEDLYPEAVHSILKNHYMDDCLEACSSAEDAIKLVNDITAIHKSGGFEIRRWSSNSKPVLETIPTEALAPSAVQFKDGAMNTTERTLGLIWHPADDTFGFKISFNRVPKSILDGTEPPTKAKMLSIIMSVYDIHGFLSPFLIKSKILLQNVHRSGVDWNCHIRQEDHASWVKWLDDLKHLESLRIPRWYKNAGTWTPCYLNENINLTSNEMIIDTQLHAFCDASIKAVATVMFWRLTRADGHVIVFFAASKSRVTPLRPVSVPRLELQGSLLAVRLAKTVQNEQKDLQADKRYFWTDSSTVLQWIRGDPRNYKPYVAHRLGEIDELSKISEWRHVPTSLNVADTATRADAPQLKFTDVWFQGPDFLRLPEDKWPRDIKNTRIPEEAVCEERNINVMVSHEPDRDFSLPNENNISSWIVLIRCTARILLLFRKQRVKKMNIDVDLMQEAENLIIKKCQHNLFATEIQCLKQNKALKPSSRIAKLTPYIDENGLLRVGGRIDRTAGVSTTTMRPVILDGKHRITRLLVEYYHRRALHGAHEMVVNELRQRYWVIKLRPTVRAVSARCLFCRYRRAAPKPQRMADLPAARLQHHRRPFSFTGVDFFGPMEVTMGRRRYKMYGVLFTCLTVRALHIELTDSLTTDATIMALRRMVSRRGTPSVIYSDNGTNLRSANTELKESIKTLNASRLLEDGSIRGIEWRFLPPAAPEMGGAWERMVRTVKTALRVALKERAPHPETLSTFLAEVEALVNSRPITHVSTDPSYPEALTPNHFLIGTSSNGPQFGVYDNNDLCLRKRWRIAQRLADMFWGRWIKEYLPTLLPRQKWINEERALRVGDYVILVESKLDRGSWRHGVVSAVQVGEDGRVRSVDVRTRTGFLRRPAIRVALLDPVDYSADSDLTCQH